MPAKNPLFACLECGKKFKTTAAAERAAMLGCPNCGGVDIDLAPARLEAIEVEMKGEAKPKKGLAGANAEKPAEHKPLA